MFGSLADYFTRSRIEKENPKRQKQFLSWEKIDKIVLVIDNASSLSKHELDKFIDSTKKNIEVLFLEPKSKQASYGDWKCLTKKEKSFLGLPTEQVFSDLRNKKYNLVINTAFGHSLYAANLISAIPADFKCGANNLYGELDLIIEKKDQNIVSYLKDVIKYLQMIRTT
ncbi:MAG: hypothetical protein K0S32_4061 [Bacteroidetes bacterium]|jgi:hypothetical protein|nr:hypothetical protein [Bacteroidota bacterium]